MCSVWGNEFGNSPSEELARFAGEWGRVWVDDAEARCSNEGWSAVVCRELVSFPGFAPFGWQDLRDASAAFSPTAGRAPDGFHAAQFKLLGQGGFTAWATLWQACEECGCDPAQLAWLLCIGMSKTEGSGLRPIAAYLGLVRLH